MVLMRVDFPSPVWPVVLIRGAFAYTRAIDRERTDANDIELETALQELLLNLRGDAVETDVALWVHGWSGVVNGSHCWRRGMQNPISEWCTGGFGDNGGGREWIVGWVRRRSGSLSMSMGCPFFRVRVELQSGLLCKGKGLCLGQSQRLGRKVNHHFISPSNNSAYMSINSRQSFFLNFSEIHRHRDRFQQLFWNPIGSWQD